MEYINYHKHSHYSNIRTIDSDVTPEQYMIRAKELGHTVYSTCEHGFQGNLYETQTLGEKYGIKPIYAVEAYYTQDIEIQDRKSYHLMLIGMTKKARHEINKILSIANTKGFYYKPRIDLNLLLSLSAEDTVVTTACVMSPLFKTELIQNNENGWYYDFLLPVQQHFGNNLYLEVQDHPHITQINFNKKILNIHKKLGIKLIHGCDSHYIHEEDAKYRDMFLSAKGFDYPEESGFIMDYPDSETILKRYKEQGVLSEDLALEALRNTLIFKDAEVVYTDKEFKIPKVPNWCIQEELKTDKYTNDDSDLVLQEIIKRSWAEKRHNVKPEKIPEYKKAIKYEMDIIKKCGMADYFILDHIIIKKAVNEYGAVLTRSGRGSAVSFLINHLLGLTEVDRIKAPIKLYPTRFMSAERILNTRSLPDIDLNLADQQPVIKASKDVLGENQIYQMVAYKPLQRSSAFRLWCKANNFDINDYNEAAKMLSDKHFSDEDVIEQFPEWENQIKDSKRWRGIIESIAPSPCSFLLLNEDIREEVGLVRVGDDTGKNKYVICCAMDGYNCDVYKNLKNDVLQVTVYSIIAQVYKLIGRPIDDIATLINNCDDKVWDLYANGLTTTINQVDSDLGKKLIMEYKPKSLAELAAWVAAIRPGFASLLNTFIHREEYSTGIDQLDELLKDSFHFMLYQESIMSYLVWLGIEEKETYDIIKKISKKKFKEEELAVLKEKLKKGWIEKVGSESGFEETWTVVNDSAAYSFNASHALSVAIDSLYGAYLKSHYPLEYFSVVFSLYSDDIDRTAKLTNELPYFGIELKGIKYGVSRADYAADKETNSIYKGIKGVKYCNVQIAEELYELSQKQEFDSFIPLLQKIISDTSVNSRQLEILTTLNFFSDFGKNKKLLKIIKLYDKFGKRKQIKKSDLEKLELNELILQKHSGKETEKLYKDIDGVGLVEDLASGIPDKELTVISQVKAEKEFLGYVSYKNEIIGPTYYIVIAFKKYNEKSAPYVTVRRLCDGEEIKTKVKTNKIFLKNKFDLYSVIKFENFAWKDKYKKVGEKFVKTGEHEKVISHYEVIKR